MHLRYSPTFAAKSVTDAPAVKPKTEKLRLNDVEWRRLQPKLPSETNTKTVKTVSMESEQAQSENSSGDELQQMPAEVTSENASETPMFPCELGLGHATHQMVNDGSQGEGRNSPCPSVDTFISFPEYISQVKNCTTSSMKKRPGKTRKMPEYPPTVELSKTRGATFLWTNSFAMALVRQRRTQIPLKAVHILLQHMCESS